MTQDTRKDRRVKIVSLNVRYKSATVDEFIENHAHDVSRGGIYIKTANPFPAGTLLKFEIRLASDQAVIAGVGRVVWKRDAAHGAGERPAGMGVKFIKIDPPSSAVIDKLVNTRSDAGRAFEAEQESSTDVPPPVLQAPPPAAAAPKSAPPPKPAPGGPPVRKATMMGIGMATGAAVPPPSNVPSPPRPTPSVPPRPTPHAPAAGPVFPKASPEPEAPKQEQTVMKQAAELLEEALREAGGSMEDVGTNPLFAGGTAPAPAKPEEAIAEDDATKARALVAGLAPAAVDEKKGPSEPPPRTTRDTPIAKVSERPKSSTRPAAPYVARVSDAPAPPKKSGPGGAILILVTAAAAAAAVVMYKDKLFGGGAAEPQPPAAHSAEPPPSSSSSASAAATASAAPSQSAEAPAASAQASASAAASASPTGSASGAAPSASAAPEAKTAAATPPAAPAPKPAPTAATPPAAAPPAPAPTAAAPKPAAPKPKPKPADEDNPY